MIHCREAKQAINLYHGVIKFLEFRDFRWQSGALPLDIDPLGAMHQVKTTLKNAQGKAVDARWRDGFVHADFRSGQRYDLTLRLEYAAPLRHDWYHSDFTSIVPMSFESSIDFIWHPGLSDGRVGFRDSDGATTIDLDQTFQRRHLNGFDVWLFERSGQLHFGVGQQVDKPFGCTDFPSLSINA